MTPALPTISRSLSTVASRQQPLWLVPITWCVPSPLPLLLRVAIVIQDLDGYTTCPEIAPPISTEVDRDSGTFGVEHFDYGPVQIASDVGWEAYRKVADNLMILFQNTGLMHGYSMNSWSDVVTYNQSFIEEWLASPQTSLYYSLQVMPDTQDKSDAMAALEDLDVEKFWADKVTDSVEPQCDCAE